MKSAWSRVPDSLRLLREIRPYECAPGGWPLPHVLAQLIQEASDEHANALGIGIEAMERKGLLWALGVLAVRIAALPAAGMLLYLETWPSTLNRLWAGREIRATAEDGTLLFEAGTDWMLLGVESRRPVDMTRLNLYSPVDVRLLGDRMIRHKPGPPPAADNAPLMSVPISALDINGHVNNTEYIRWAYDMLYAAGHKPDIHELRATFHAEARLGDVIRLDTLILPQSLVVTGRKLSGAESAPVFSVEYTTRAD